jgi:putative hydrolase of the HAD superfamily
MKMAFHRTRFQRLESALAVRAVVFDYGMVLTGPPDPKAHAELLRITGMSAEKLDALYWADRSAFDAGKLNGHSYWRGIVQKAGLTLSPAAIEELIHWDARLWMALNPPMLAWAGALKARGIRTAILSNMGDTVLEAMEREFDWLARFDVLVWSYQLHMAKPDAAIYHYALEKLGTRPEETLFVDDRQVNVEAAASLGIKALVFTTAEDLRADLIAHGFDKELPLPANA